MNMIMIMMNLLMVKKPIDDVVEPRRSKCIGETSYGFGSNFYFYLVEGSRSIVLDVLETFIVENDPMTFNEAMSSRDASFWEEAINNEMDLPLGCKPITCK